MISKSRRTRLLRIALILAAAVFWMGPPKPPRPPGCHGPPVPPPPPTPFEAPSPG